MTVVELLRELVAIPSVNPQGDPGVPRPGEGEISKFVGDFLLKLGATVDLQFVESDRPNVIGRFKSKTSKHHILLGPHLDTVSVTGMTMDPFAAEWRDGKIWGRGAADTKGPMAAMLTALAQLVEKKSLPEHTDIWFAGLMGEESGNDGIEFLMNSDYFRKKGVKLDFGIAGEPTELKIVHRHKGALWFKIKTHGKSCHASCPDLGENAILKMRKAMDYVSDQLPLFYAHLKDDLLGSSSFCLTTLKGGSKVNIVPDLCEAEVDHRSLPQESHEEVINRLRKDLPGCEVEIISDRPGLNTPADNPSIQKLVDILSRRALGVERGAFLTGAPWFADCSLMAKAGIPAIAFGPGSIKQAHTKDEYIEVDELEKGVSVFFDFLGNLD